MGAGAHSRPSDLVKNMNKGLFWVVPGAFFLMPFAFGMGSLSWQVPALVVIVFAGALGAGIFTLTKKTRSQSDLPSEDSRCVSWQPLIGIAGLDLGAQFGLLTQVSSLKLHTINAAKKSAYQSRSHSTF